MCVLVRIDVGRIAAGQVPKRLELPLQLLLDDGDIVAVDDRVERRPSVALELPLPEVDVETKAEIGVLPRVRRQLPWRPASGPSGSRSSRCRADARARRPSLIPVLCPKSSALTIRRQRNGARLAELASPVIFGLSTSCIRPPGYDSNLIGRPKSRAYFPRQWTHPCEVVSGADTSWDGRIGMKSARHEPRPNLLRAVG